MSDPQTKVARSGLPPAAPVLWSLWGELRDPLGTLIRARERYGDIIRFRHGEPLVVLGHPDAVKRVLVENPANYPKGAREMPWTGQGVFTSEGELWIRQRRMMQPAFHRERLVGMVGTLVDGIRGGLDRWEARARSGEPFEVLDELSSLTLALVGRVVYSAEPGGAVSEGILRAVHLLNHPPSLLKQALRRLVPFLPPPRWWIDGLRAVDGFAYELIRRRREQGPGGVPEDVLAQLMEACDGDGTGMTDKQLRDELVTLLISGHEAVAVGVAWTLYLLHRHPEVERKLRAEVASVLGERLPTAEDVPRLRYINQVFQEVLRLYPPAWVFARRARAPDRIGGHEIPAGTVVSIAPYLLHRHPALWENPEAFDPERFSPEQVARQQKFSYLPFGGGQRLCIGNNLALMEATLLLAMLVQRFRITVHQEEPPALKATLTLRPRDGLRISLSPAPRIASASAG